MSRFIHLLQDWLLKFFTMFIHVFSHVSIIKLSVKYLRNFSYSHMAGGPVFFLLKSWPYRKSSTSQHNFGPPCVIYYSVHGMSKCPWWLGEQSSCLMFRYRANLRCSRCYWSHRETWVKLVHDPSVNPSLVRLSLSAKFSTSPPTS